MNPFHRHSGSFPVAVIALLIFLLSMRDMQAQWTTQAINLRPGWNSVHLDVQPEPRDCGTLLGGLPIESVWAWNRRPNSVQFLTDANELLPGQPDWLVYLPSVPGADSLSTLFALHGGRSYLIKSTATTNVVLHLQGHPVVASPTWIQDSLNLVGFLLDPVAPPTFGQFFSTSTAHRGQAIFRLMPQGDWQAVQKPLTTAMQPGEAFWVYTSGPSTFSGPLGLTLQQSSGIQFGKTVPETVLTIQNNSTTNRTVSIASRPSETPRDANSSPVLGDIPLSIWKMDISNRVYGWYPLSSVDSFLLKSGEKREVRLAPRRVDFAKPTGVTRLSSGLYQGLLTLSDNAGSRWTIPVSAARAASLPPTGLLSDAANKNVYTGLWAGSAVVNQVSQPGVSDQPQPAGSQAQFRLLIHVDTSGNARLLQHVTLMWRNGMTNDQGGVTQPGSYVLVTDDTLLPQYSGSSFSGGKSVGRRISAVAFGHALPLAMSGPFADTADPNNLLGCPVTVGYDDPLNPFKHRFHPDHDNLDATHTALLPEGVESYTITRQISLNFTGSDPLGRASAQWGSEQLGGWYSETINGLNKSAVRIRGTFTLNRISLVPLLNDGN